jgi:hypothetical protein
MRKITRASYGLVWQEARTSKRLTRKDVQILTDGQISWSRVRAIEMANEGPPTEEEIQVLNHLYGTAIKFIHFEHKTLNQRFEENMNKIQRPMQVQKFKEYIWIRVQETQSSLIDASVEYGKTFKMRIPKHELEMTKKRLGKKFKGVIR